RKFYAKMLTKRAAIKKTEQFIKELKASGVHVRRAVLFGSYAHGKPHKWSDIDVALVADEFKGPGYNDAHYYSDIRYSGGYSIISTRTYNTKQFTPRIDPFVEVIMEHGIEITC
ncbi:MAG: nucleotidyltransferase domain-containing protein, partial [Chitinophagaceae bacterium]|nr:nucleotidyltransferase domain-containing protein [Chitinophagaceae bacterium]